MTAAAGPPTGSPPTLTHRQILTILVGLMLGMFLSSLDQTVVATAIRVIGDDLNDLSAQAWVTTAFLITSTITTPLYGKLSDIYGRKPFFLFAIAVFIAGSVLCSFSTSMYMLAGFRAVQGVGAGGLFTLALAILSDIVAPRERARYQGYFMAVFGLSSLLGPLIGGALSGADTILGITGWRWIFLVNVPVGAAAFVVVSLVLTKGSPAQQHRIDYYGALTLIVGLVPLLLVAEQGRTWGWASFGSLACYVIGAVGLTAFVLVEHRVGEDALLPLRLFRNRAFSLTAAQTAIIGVGMFGGITVLPLYLQIVQGNSPTRSGLLTLPMVLGITITSLVSGRLTSKIGHYKMFPIIGSALMVTAMLMMWRLSVDTSYWYTGTAMLILGSGLGFTMQTLTLAMQNAVPPADTGVATSTSTFFRQIGGTVGVAAFISILYSVLPAKLRGAFAAAEGDPAFQQAKAADPAGYQVVTGPAVTDNTSILNSLSEALTRPWKDGFTSSLSVVFISGACVLAAAFILSLLTKELPLRGTAAPATAPPVDQTDAAEEQQPTRPTEPDHSPAGSRELVGSSAAAVTPDGLYAFGGTAAGPGPTRVVRSWHPLESPHPACPVSLDRVRERRRRQHSSKSTKAADPPT